MLQKTSSKSTTASKEKTLLNEEEQLNRIESVNKDLNSTKSAYESHVTLQQEGKTKLEQKLEILNHVDKNSESIQKDYQLLVQDGLVYIQALEKKLDYYNGIAKFLTFTLKSQLEEDQKRKQVLLECKSSIF